MSTPLITAWIPKVSAEPSPAEVHRHLTLLFQKLGNHTTAFSLLSQKLNTVKAGTSTTVFEGSGGGSTPSTTTGIQVNNQSGATSYATVSGDNNALIVLSDASPIAVSLTSQSPPWSCFIANQGTGTSTLTPATGTISYAGNPGSVSLPILGGYCCLVVFDGTAWWAWTEPIVPVTFGAVLHQFLTSYDAATGLFTAAQPAFTDISGVANPSQLPTPTAVTLGGVESAGPTASQWINQIDTSGVPHLSQPAFTNISGVATTAQIGTGTPLAGEYVDGGTGAWTALPSDTLSGTSSAIGGSPLIAGQTISTTVTVTGATTSMVAACSPETYPGDGSNWDSYVSAADTVTVRLTAVIALTPSSSAYNVRVVK